MQLILLLEDLVNIKKLTFGQKIGQVEKRGGNL
jgi:hypothetical protein